MFFGWYVVEVQTNSAGKLSGRVCLRGIQRILCMSRIIHVYLILYTPQLKWRG